MASKSFRLYLRYFVKEADFAICVPLETFVCLFVLKFIEKTGKFDVRLIKKRKQKGEIEIQMDISELGFINVNSAEDNHDDDDDDQVKACVLPVVFVASKKLCITGLCSVLRHLLKAATEVKDLLGYQGGCLSAPAEVSTWTRFCEVDLPAAVKETVLRRPHCLPRDLPKFEAHLRQPTKIHNIRKRMQKEANKEKDQKRSDDPIQEFAKISHIYAEGPDLLLSDLILYSQFFVLFSAFPDVQWESLLPKTFAWFDQAMGRNEKCLCLAKSLTLYAQQQRFNETNFFEIPIVPEESLYKSDPRRHNPSARAFTRQHDVTRILANLRGIELLPSKDLVLSPIDWKSLPELVHPLGGQLPAKRLEKKCQQLESLASAVILEISPEPGDVIVDFCSGGGHLALLLAAMLPEAIVYLVENKEESLRRAMERSEALGLTNTKFFQCNLDYFVGSFDLGVSLHACGVATDLVLEACLRSEAHFVCCPCCYGGLQENHVLSYPRSEAFKDVLAFKDYLVIGHTADQTHFTNDKHDQGLLAMSIIDSDRGLRAVDHNYSVSLTKLKPLSCTPKNNLLIGKNLSR